MFSSIRMTYRKQLWISQPCAPVLWGELCSSIHGWMLHDSHHSDRFVLSTDLSFYVFYDITHLYYVSKFVTNFVFAFSLDSNRHKIFHLLVFLLPDLEPKPFAWCEWPLHMHWQIIVSHNLVTEIKKMLTHSQICTQIPFQWDMTSKDSICLSIPPVMQELLPFLRLNLISVQ